MNQKVLEFLKNRNPKLCVLSTASINGKPESAVVGYSIYDSLSIVLSTHKESRKVKNITNNNTIALVFGFSFTENYVQYEGIAKIIDSGEEYAKLDSFFYGQNPDALKFKAPDTVFIEIKPTWIRFMDMSQTPPKIEEVTLS